MISRSGIIATLAAVATLGTAAAAKAEEGVFMKNALGAIGLVEPERPAISYRERAPLVLPPSGKGAAANLPPPQASARESDPQWPKDPEARARARASAEARKPSGLNNPGGRMNDNNQTLSVDEIRRGRNPNSGATASTPEYKPGDSVRESTWLDPLKLFSGKKNDDALSASYVEPDRDLLTDPPTGYRKPPGGRLVKTEGAPVGGPNGTDREEADPGAYMRAKR